MKRPSLLATTAPGIAVLWAAACSAAAPSSPPEEPSSLVDAGDRDGASDGAAGQDAATPPAEVEPGEADSAGRATTYVFDARAFEQPAATLSGAERSAWITGQATFQLAWTASAGTDRSGLGPTFNAASCEACHTRNGRGGPPPAANGALVTTLLRLSRPGTNSQGGPLGDPTYGDQLQSFAVAGVAAEGSVRIDYEPIAGAYGDGAPFTRQRPMPLVEATLGDLPNDVMLSVRQAQPTFGMGFLEAISDADVLAGEDPNDADGDGISGRANRVWDVRTGTLRVGRFGWKGNQPTVEQQSAAAFAGDIGITSALFPDANCPAPQASCLAASAGSIELSDSRLAAVTMFMRGTSVPGRRDVGAPDVLRGKALFRDMGCAACHVPSFTTSVVAGATFLSGQRVWPYTDLLLHDMGEGLADGRPDFAASGAEWRTPPLWGLGLLGVVSGHEQLLHDGRARGVAEAILWHGGEAAPAAERFRVASSEERRVLLAFLRSL